jgi:hypothetical protein
MFRESLKDTWCAAELVLVSPLLSLWDLDQYPGAILIALEKLHNLGKTVAAFLLAQDFWSGSHPM